MNRTRTRTRSVWAAAALALASTLGTATMAVADDVANNLDTTVDATAESMALNLGGADGTATFFVSPTNGDGKNGCNLTGSTELLVNVASSNSAVATAGFGSDGRTGATFTACGDTRTVTVRPVGVGTTTVSLSQVSNNSSGTFNFAPATFSVTVSAKNTAPQVSVTGVSQGASYEKGGVPAATCEVTDPEDGAVAPFPAALSGSLDPDGLGSQTATCSYTDRGPDPLTVSVSKTYTIVDPSAPEIGYTLSPVVPDGLDGWYRDSVALTWDVREPQSPASLQKAGCVDQLITADQHATTYSCSATSSGGSTGPVQVTIKRDGNGPVVSYDETATAAPDGDNGWYVTPVTATFRATDAFSGMAAGTDTRTATSTGDGAAVSIASPAFSDRAGNPTPAGAAHSPAFKIDTVDPAVGDAVVTGTRGSNEWYTSEVVASFEATDATSGVAGDNPRTASTGTDQGEVTLLSPAFSDVAGNTTAAGARTVTVKVDSVAPSVELVGGPDQDASYTFGSVPAAPTCTASDATSGVDGDCQVTRYGTGVGTHTLSATATDRAGNTTTVNRTYTVLPWDLKGFYQPVDMGGVINKVKGGSTVPLKFEIFAGATEVTDTAAVASFGVAQIACSSSAVTDTIELVTTGGTSLRYDTTGGQFVQNWKTPTAIGCYAVTMTARDGSRITARFQVTK